MLVTFKMLIDLAKLYVDDDLKFGGEFYDVLDQKIKIYKSFCRMAGIPARGYHEAYSIMLKGKARDFYYHYIDSQGLTFLEMIARIYTYFHTPENHQFYINEWRSTVLKDVITANPEKNITWCLEFVITKLQKVHEGLKHNYGSSEHSLAGQLANACQGVRACNNVLLRPTSTFEGITSDLRSAIGIYQRSHPQSARPAYIANHADDDAYYINRRYGRNDGGYRRGGYNSRGGPKGNSRGSYRGNYGKSSNKKCFVCGKPGC
jgi:hypothetical protein